ncbi:MAG: chromosome segregation ATPase, partial [Arenicella sp.]
MNNNLSPKYNSATFKTKGAAAKIKSRVLLVFSVLIFNSASALGQTNLELIEQQIEKAENSLKTTEKFIEQLLWRDVPANQAETQEVKARAAQDATELSTLATIVDSSQARLLQSKNQLERSNRILITSQQELQQAKKEIDNLEKQTRLSLDSLAKQAVNIEQLEVETRTVNASIDESTPELERLKSILETAYQQSQQREQQTQQLRQSEAEFEQTLARKQEKISAQTSALLDLRKQLQALKTKMLNEQDDWAKVGAQIATRDSKREQLETKLGDNSRLTREAIQELEVLKGELQKAKSATTKKRDKLVASKSNIALAKRALKDSQQQLRRAQADLKNDQSAE